MGSGALEDEIWISGEDARSCHKEIQVSIVFQMNLWFTWRLGEETGLGNQMVPLRLGITIGTPVPNRLQSHGKSTILIHFCP